MRLDLTRRGERRGCHHGCPPFFLGGLTIVAHPGEAMRIKDRKNRIADAGRLRRFNAQARRRERGIGDGHEIIGRYRRRSEIAESFLFVLAVEQVGDEVCVDRVFGNCGKPVDQPYKDRGELAEKPIVEIKRLVEALISKRDPRRAGVGLQVGERPLFRGRPFLRRCNHEYLLGAGGGFAQAPWART